jgi:hypothetical protein
MPFVRELVADAEGPEQPFSQFASAMKALDIDAVEWPARSGTGIPGVSLDPLGAGASSPIAWNQEDVTGLFRGTSQTSPPQIALDKAFTLSLTDGDDLTGLWMGVRYSVSEPLHR